MRVTRRYSFSASHRLDSPRLDAETNRRLYGKCNNPFGHGHNYVLDVSAQGAVDPRTGRVLDPRALDRLVRQQVLDPFDRRDLNTECAAFGAVVPTSENLGTEIMRRLKANWSDAFPGGGPELERICIAETERNIFQVSADETA